MDDNKTKDFRVSNIVTLDKIRSWKSGDTITIKAGTGVGKSYWVKNILYAFAKKQNKKILMLIHRIDCIDQFTPEIIRNKKTDVIDIKTYQKLEYKELKKYENDLSEYAYIVCDEFHYFMGDAAYSNQTDISLNLILRQSNAIKIFMSATGDDMKRYINKIKDISTIDYEIPITYKFIKQLTFFNKDETLEKFIEEAIQKSEKAIFFIQSANKAYELYKKYKKYVLFNCGKSDKHYKYVKKEKIKNMLINEKFEEQILITTTCMDAGVNINDESVKHIVVDVKDIGVLIQCIGRKRLQNNKDYINLYIKTIDNNQLGGIETQLKNKITKAEYLSKHTVKEYIEKYPRELDYSNIIYDEIVDEKDKGTKVINELMYFKCKYDLLNISIMKMYKKFGYWKYLANLFGFKDENTGKFNYRLIEEDWRKSSLEEYLESIVGIKLYKEEQKELIEKINVRVNGRQQKSYIKLNEGLKMIDLPYVIESKREQIENKKCTYWIVGKIIYNLTANNISGQKSVSASI